MTNLPDERHDEPDMFGKTPGSDPLRKSRRLYPILGNQQIFFWVRREHKKVQYLLEYFKVIHAHPIDKTNPFLKFLRKLGNEGVSSQFISKRYRTKLMGLVLRSVKAIARKHPDTVAWEDLRSITVNLDPVDDPRVVLKQLRKMDQYLHKLFYRPKRSRESKTWWCRGAIWRIEIALFRDPDFDDEDQIWYKVHAHCVANCRTAPNRDELLSRWISSRAGGELEHPHMTNTPHKALHLGHRRLLPNHLTENQEIVQIKHLNKVDGSINDVLSNMKKCLNYTTKDPISYFYTTLEQDRDRGIYSTYRHKTDDNQRSHACMCTLHFFHKLLKRKTKQPPIRWIGRTGVFDGRNWRQHKTVSSGKTSPRGESDQTSRPARKQR